MSDQSQHLIRWCRQSYPIQVNMAHEREVSIYWRDEDQLFIAEVPELPNCMAHGDSQDAAAQERTGRYSPLARYGSRVRRSDFPYSDRQLSTKSSGTRSNSFRLPVTRVSPNDLACAAIKRS